MDKDCVFCKISNKEIPAKIEYEDDNILVFHDNAPIAPVHLLIIPKKHIVNLSEVTPEDVDLLGNMLVVGRKMAEKFKINKAFRIGVANGKLAGQTVFHMHFHITGGWNIKYNREEDKA